MTKTIAGCVSVVGVLVAGLCFAETAQLDWNPVSASDLAGYKVYSSQVSGVYGAPLVVLGPVLTYQTGDLPAGLNYFVMTAYDGSGNESAYSNEVSKLIAQAPPPPPSATLTSSVSVVAPGQPIAVTVTNGPGNPGDWIGFISQGAAPQEVDTTGLWAYLNGSKISKPAGLKSATVTFTAPTKTGLWTFRLYANDSWTDLVAESAVVTVGTVPPPPPPPPPPATGLTIVSQSASEIVIEALATDCPGGVSTSTKGSTAAKPRRTVTCKP